MIQKIIAGLGNPGAQYENTRHNAGFAAIDALADDLRVKMNKVKFKAAVGEGHIGGVGVLLLKPMNFMNNSGESVAEALRFYQLDASALLVIYDDATLPVGKLRLRPQGTAGGHNGVKHIILRANTDVFDRLKIGVGEKPERWDLADYVLSRFDKAEQETMAIAYKKAADAAAHVIRLGIESGMNAYNGDV